MSALGIGGLLNWMLRLYVFAFAFIVCLALWSGRFATQAEDVGNVNGIYTDIVDGKVCSIDERTAEPNCSATPAVRRVSHRKRVYSFVCDTNVQTSSNKQMTLHMLHLTRNLACLIQKFDPCCLTRSSFNYRCKRSFHEYT